MGKAVNGGAVWGGGGVRGSIWVTTVLPVLVYRAKQQLKDTMRGS